MRSVGHGGLPPGGERALLDVEGVPEARRMDRTRQRVVDLHVEDDVEAVEVQTRDPRLHALDARLHAGDPGARRETDGETQ